MLCPAGAFASRARLAGVDDTTKIARFTPDLVVEIVSPTDRSEAIDKRIAKWLAAGVRLLWILRPKTRSITVYAPGNEPQTLGSGRILTGGEVLPGFRVRAADFFT